MKKLFSLFLVTTGLWASAACVNVANKAMKTNTLMIVDVARILPLYPKTIISNSGTQGWDAVIETHALNKVNTHRLTDIDNNPISGSMVVSVDDLESMSLKLNTPDMPRLIDLHITGCSGSHNQYFHQILDKNQELNLFIIFTNDVTWIVEEFLYGCTNLTTLDLSPLLNVTNIARSFLALCAGLRTLDLSPLSNVKSIDSRFLKGCTGLTTLDVSPLSQVTSIRDHFLSCCTGLTTLDLSPLSQVTSIGDHFLYGCSGLTILDLSSLSNVTTIENCFLYGCTGLTKLDLSPLSQVTNIGCHFLQGCTGLTKLDLSPLSQAVLNESEISVKYHIKKQEKDHTCVIN